MTDLLKIINEKMISADIPYEFAEWKSEVRYPYFVGEYIENNSYYEDNRTVGTFIIDGWSRSGFKELLEISDKIKVLFNDLRYVNNGSSCWIRYGGAQLIPSGEENLMKITVTLYVTEWKGD